MITEGKMTPRGMELYNFAEKNGLLPEMDEDKKSEGLFPEIPEYFLQALKNKPKAGKKFESLPPSHKLQYLGWIMAAKKEETRTRRMKELLDLLEAGKKLGMK